MPRTFKYFLFTIGIVLLFFGLWQIRTILSYILVSGILSLMASPLTRAISKIEVNGFKIPRSINAGLSLLLIIGFLLGIISLFAPLLAEQARAISNINVEEVIVTLEKPLIQLENWLAQYNITQENTATLLRNRLSEILNISDVTGIFSALAGALGNIFIAFFSICFITFFFLKEEGLFFNIILTASPSKYTPQVQKILTNTKKLLTRYFLGVVGQITLISVLVSVGLSIFGVKNAVIIGLFAGIINVIPYIGPIIGAIVGIILTITSNLDLDFSTQMVPLLIKVASVFLGVQLMDNFVFQPFIFSNSVNAHPLEIFILILIAGTVAGIAGMIVAIPLYTFLRIIAKEFLSQFKIVQSLTKNL